VSRFRVYLLRNDRIEWGESMLARSAHKAAARARAKWADRPCPGSAWSIEVWNGTNLVHWDDFHPTDSFVPFGAMQLGAASTPQAAH